MGLGVEIFTVSELAANDVVRGADRIIRRYGVTSDPQILAGGGWPA
jgi:hypothetical protein